MQLVTELSLHRFCARPKEEVNPTTYLHLLGRVILSNINLIMALDGFHRVQNYF